MSAHTVLACQITPGREDEARGVLRDYVRYLEGFGGEVSVYRTLYGGELSGRIIVYLRAEDSATRAAIIDKILADGANNPYQKAIESTSPALSGQARSLYRSIDPDLPTLTDSPLLQIRAMNAAAGKRAEAEEALRGGRRHIEASGRRAGGFILETAGTASDRYAFAACADSMAALDDGERQVREAPPGPVATALANGTLISVSRRIDRRWDV
jgi:hypothetical protein